jgi:hypothetical protein
VTYDDDGQMMMKDEDTNCVDRGGKIFSALSLLTMVGVVANDPTFKIQNLLKLHAWRDGEVHLFGFPMRRFHRKDRHQLYSM